ncbi:tetratricopeptide repeat protein [Deltaproteobacteria bacterium OttesenSCG-928-K17]|nr:tetratricopeptide repeat protein [Deltaproteobacteria bacterium OttesenSCG-928-K17]
MRRDDVDRVVVEFFSAVVGQGGEIPPAGLVTKVELAPTGDNLTATVNLSAIRYEVRHFAGQDKRSVTLDFKSLEAEGLTSAPEEGLMAPLKMPDLNQLAAGLAAKTDEGDSPAEHLYHRLVGRLANMDNKGALEDMGYFQQKFPRHKLAEPVSFLMAETLLHSAPIGETYAPATEMLRNALEKWPQSEMAPRARFMEAEADRLAGHYNEAAAKFKILADDALTEKSDIYSRLALLNGADLLLNLGLIDEARSLIDPVLERGQADRLGLEAYVRSGMADFYQGFFSQANENFREALKLNPQLYLTYPEMLYAAGEGYHYLNRPDLSRGFLFQALNLMPDHPKADVIMARIGDDYRKEGRDREAMAIYGAAHYNYPNGDGGLISQVRLADMGALHSFFSQDKVFDALERGTRQATVEMYKKIVEAGSNSPLLQLAQLKIGTALAEDGENSEAVKWLRELEINNPGSSLLPEALPALNRALIDEINLRRELGDWQAITDLYADNSSYLSDEDRLPIMRLVASAHEKLGQFAEAGDILRAMEPENSADRLTRYKGLVESGLKTGKNLDALNYALEMEKEFPAENEWLSPRLTEIGRRLALPRNAKAAGELGRLVDQSRLEPARKEALMDAIEIEINGQRYDQAQNLMDIFSRDYPQDELTPEYLLTQAKIEQYRGRPQEAWKYWSKFRGLFPDDPRSPQLLKDQIAEAEKMGLADDVVRFKELYRVSNPDDPKGKGMLLDKLRGELDSGRYGEARVSLGLFKRDYPKDASIVDLLTEYSDKAWAAGHLDEARWALDELLRDYPKDKRTPGLLFKRGTDEWKKGRPQAAKELWAELRSKFPDSPLAGQTYVEEYRLNSAGGPSQQKAAQVLADEFRQARPNDPAQADLILEEAKNHLAAGREAQALAAWDRFRQSYPNDARVPDLLLVQARQEMKMGRSGDGLARYRQIIEQHPSSPLTPDVYLELAAVEGKMGRLQDAWDHLERFNTAYRSHPDRPKAILDQAELGRRIGLTDPAINLYRTFRRDYPQAAETPSTYLAQARLELAAGRPSSAIRTLEEGALASPGLDSDPAVQGFLTELYLEDGQVEKWAAIVEKNLDRGSATAANQADRYFKYNQLALVYQQLGRREEAERNFDAALANRPADASPESLYAIGKAYKEMGASDKYGDVLRILSTSPDPMWKTIAEGELASLGAIPATM